MRLRPVTLATIVAALAGVATSTAEDASATPARPVKVMTRNMYLGADFNGPVAAVGNKTGVAALLALGNSTWTLRDVVRQTNFPARAELLAREIADHDPDLIGLQEVAKWRTGLLQLTPAAGLGQPNATQPDLDFLEILLDELDERGEHYAVVEAQDEADVEGPAFTGNPFTGVGYDPTTARDVRMTLRDVILRRVDDAVQVHASGSEHYATKLTISVAGLPYAFTRGYNWADVTVNKRSFRFVNTHLESVRSMFALGQATELLQGKGAPSSSRSTIMVGDFNSDPRDDLLKSGDPTPHWAPYRLLSGDDGPPPPEGEPGSGPADGPYRDEWLLWAPAPEGWTSGFSELVDDPDTQAIDHRIDLVLGRRADGTAIPVDRGWIVGTDPDNRTSTGLWPSDHAGVVMKLRP